MTLYFEFSLDHVSSANIEGAGSMTYTAASLRTIVTKQDLTHVCWFYAIKSVKIGVLVTE